MKEQIIALSIGLLAGAVSWAVVAVVSGQFEPFDSGIGFALGQIVLSVIAFWIGYRKKINVLFGFLLGAWVGMNVYAYTFGSSEQKAWILLGIFSTLFLMFYPLLFGVIGKIVNIIQQKYNKKIQRTV